MAETRDLKHEPPTPLGVDGRAVDAIAHFLLWFDRNLYETPHDAAVGLLRRLAHEGYVVGKAGATDG